MKLAIADEPQPKHNWVLNTKDPHPYWEERHCNVCDLEDMRVRKDQQKVDASSHRNNWGINTPCILPVPKEVSYEDLMGELKANKVKEQPRAEGHPGVWTFGLGEGNNYPHLDAKTLETGWSKLLRWFRARQFDPNKYSDFEYAKSLANPSNGCCIDDD